MDENIRRYIIGTKNALRQRHDVAASFASISEYIRRECEGIRSLVERGESPLPQLDYDSVRRNRVSDSDLQMIRRRGAVVVRKVFRSTLATQWNEQLSEYIDENAYLSRARDKARLDNYFSQLGDSEPQIFGLYWSKPQVLARQAESMAITKRFLNRLWSVDGPMGAEFNPDFDFTYADRVRRRRPGDTSFGLSPHMDGGSYERWVDPAYQGVYQRIFEGDWQSHDAWRATFRTQTREYASPAVCSMFRTFQGWTALTTQGPGDGTLNLVPIINGIAYILLRALQDDVAEDDLCGAAPGKALGADPDWHAELLTGLVKIPLLEPGDTVWWHPDVIHSVENEHLGQDYSNVIYIGASPGCAKNETYARRQAVHFQQGRSAPDFAPEDYEIDFRGRATVDDLTKLGRAQMAL